MFGFFYHLSREYFTHAVSIILECQTFFYTGHSPRTRDVKKLFREFGNGTVITYLIGISLSDSEYNPQSPTFEVNT